MSVDGWERFIFFALVVILIALVIGSISAAFILTQTGVR